MKMFYVANARMPTERAHGIQLAKMCEAFVEAGVDLELIVPHIKGRSDRNLKEYYGLRRNLRVHFLPVLPQGNSRFAFNLRALSFALVSFVYLLFRMFREKACVIYTIDLDQFSFALLPLLHRPVFIETHGSKRVTFLSRFFFKHVRGVVAVSDGVLRRLRETLRFEATALVAPNGIDLQVFGREGLSKNEARQELGIAETQPLFLYVGKFYDWKGLEILPQIAVSLPEVVLYALGGTKDEFKRAARVTTIPSTITVVEAVEYRMIPTWMAAADFFLLTGTAQDRYSFNETSPMKLFEYLAARRPIIAARTPAIASVVTAEDVIFYEPDSVDDLVEKMRQVLRTSEGHSSHVEHGFKTVQGLSWQRRAEKILGMINDLT